MARASTTAAGAAGATDANRETSQEEESSHGSIPVQRDLRQDQGAQNQGAPVVQDSEGADNSSEADVNNRNGYGTRKSFTADREVGRNSKRWQPEEQELLSRLVDEHGPKKKWAKIAAQIPGRTGKQCRERYMNHLRPDIRKDKWTPREEQILAHSHSTLGTQWSVMAKSLPGRTENSIKNHWNTIFRCKTMPSDRTVLSEYVCLLRQGYKASAAYAAAVQAIGEAPPSPTVSSDPTRQLETASLAALQAAEAHGGASHLPATAEHTAAGPPSPNPFSSEYHTFTIGSAPTSGMRHPPFAVADRASFNNRLPPKLTSSTPASPMHRFSVDSQDLHRSSDDLLFGISQMQVEGHPIFASPAASVCSLSVEPTNPAQIPAGPSGDVFGGPYDLDSARMISGSFSRMPRSKRTSISTASAITQCGDETPSRRSVDSGPTSSGVFRFGSREGAAPAQTFAHRMSLDSNASARTNPGSAHEPYPSRRSLDSFLACPSVARRATLQAMNQGFDVELRMNHLVDVERHPSLQGRGSGAGGGGWAHLGHGAASEPRRNIPIGGSLLFRTAPMPMPQSPPPRPASQPPVTDLSGHGDLEMMFHPSYFPEQGMRRTRSMESPHGRGMASEFVPQDPFIDVGGARDSDNCRHGMPQQPLGGQVMHHSGVFQPSLRIKQQQPQAQPCGVWPRTAHAGAAEQSSWSRQPRRHEDSIDVQMSSGVMASAEAPRMMLSSAAPDFGDDMGWEMAVRHAAHGDMMHELHGPEQAGMLSHVAMPDAAMTDIAPNFDFGN